MKRVSNSSEVKKQNKNRVFRCINENDKISMPDIAGLLEMSVPTVMQMIKELKESGLVEEVGEFQSRGGRKAKAIATIKSACYAIGLDITGNHIGMVLTDLSQKVLHHVRIRKTFKNEESYFRELGDILLQFLAECNLDKEQIWGVGIAVPAIVDSNNNYIAYSHALNMRDTCLEKYLAYIPFDCVVINDAKAAAMPEYIDSKISKNMMFLSLSNTVGGAVIIGKDIGGQSDGTMKLFMGDNWCSGEFGHIVIHPGGEKCYCGKQGCLDAYCSAKRLSEYTDGNLDLFMKKMEQGNKEFQEIWKEYLTDLSIAVDNLRMSFDCDVVLGGYVGNYMGPYIQNFRKMVAEKNIFGYTGDYVKEGRYSIESSALGAAMYQVEKYISTI